jgi:predicted amidohydrolase
MPRASAGIIARWAERVTHARQDDRGVNELGAGPVGMERAGGFLVVERAYCDDASLPTVGLANIHAIVPGIEDNKAKIERACHVFKQRGVNVAVFPEFCLSGYFWEDEHACWEYMDQAVTERHLDWIDTRLRPLIDETFRVIVLNNITRGEGRRFLNTTFFVADEVSDLLAPEWTYTKVFLPGLEKVYTESGHDDRLVVTSRSGDAKLGFTTCYDYLFNDLLREYAVVDEVDAIIELASWRAAATRDYPGMNVRTDLYYGDLWDNVLSASSATNQVWTIACNAVGRHGVTGGAFWGGSGIWAPSGLKLIQASHLNEELVIVHNIDLVGARRQEKDDFDYAFDFSEVYRPMDHGRGYTREIPLGTDSQA